MPKISMLMQYVVSEYFGHLGEICEQNMVNLLQLESCAIVLCRRQASADNFSSRHGSFRPINIVTVSSQQPH